MDVNNIRAELFSDLATLLEQSTGSLYTAHFETSDVREAEFNMRLKEWVEGLARDLREVAARGDGHVL